MPGAELVKPSHDDVQRCAAMLREGSKSFWAAGLLLPERVRVPAGVLYAFCRVADDLVDEGAGPPQKAIGILRDRLLRIYEGRPLDVPVDRAMTVVVHELALPRAVFDALIDGLEWDAVGRRYETLDDLEGYCARVASTVGVLMTLLMGERNPATLARATDLGVAMQLTNIARDVGEDARRGRIYLPLSWLADAELDAASFLAKPRFSRPLGQVVQRLLAAAEGLYNRSDLGVAHLPADCRVAIRAARLIYSDIGRVIEKQGFNTVERRAYVSAPRKLWLLFRALSARFERPIKTEEPALLPVRFLVDASGSTS